MTNTPSFNPSPKQVFQKDPNLIKSHNDLLAKPDLQMALTVALMEMVHRNTSALGAKGPPDALMAAAAQYRTEGALAFIDIFKRLGEVPQPQTRVSHDNLQTNQ